LLDALVIDALHLTGHPDAAILAPAFNPKPHTYYSTHTTAYLMHSSLMHFISLATQMLPSLPQPM
jgi:hypothetical protein